MTGVYVHLPFCLQKCPYCGFYSEVGREGEMEAYVTRVLKEAKSYPSAAVDTIYFGGGTPSALPAPLLIKLLEGLLLHFPSHGEITIEVNPATVNLESLRLLRQNGFNRISIGIQSLSDQTLKTIGRAHDAAAAIRTVLDAEKAGFTNISGDIIFALPDESEASLFDTAKKMCALPLTHISAYSLSIEPGTPFSKKALSLPDEDMERHMYWRLTDTFLKNGFLQYEISNYARAGYAARHNTIYWTGGQYIGLGAGAHSFYANARYENVADIAAYIKSENPITSVSYVDQAERQEEMYMLGLRMVRGIPETDNPQIDGLCRDGLLWRKNGYIGLTRRGMDVLNYVIYKLCE